MFHVIALFGLLGVLAGALMLWNATGRRGFTFLPRPELDAMAAQEGSLTGLFGNEPVATAPPIRTSFALGLFPSGFGVGLVSVSSLTGLCLPAIVYVLRGNRRRRV